MVFRGRLSDLSSWIWCILSLTLVAVVLLWKELQQVSMLRSVISDNKVVTLSSSVLVARHGARRSLSSFSDELSRRKTEEEIFSTGSFSKRCYLLVWRFHGALHILTGQCEDLQDGGEDLRYKRFITWQPCFFAMIISD
jgi:hypothetical protein